MPPTPQTRNFNAVANHGIDLDVVKSDTDDIPGGSVNGVYVGGAGNLKVVTAGGETVTFNNCQAGSIIPWAVARVFSSGTTATGLIGSRG